MMSESSGGRAGVGGVSGGVEDRVDASYVLSWFLSRVVASVPHAGPGSGEFSLGGVLWKTVLCGLAYVAGFACGWLLPFERTRIGCLSGWLILVCLLCFPDLLF